MGAVGGGGRPVAADGKIERMQPPRSALPPAPAAGPTVRVVDGLDGIDGIDAA